MLYMTSTMTHENGPFSVKIQFYYVMLYMTISMPHEKDYFPIMFEVMCTQYAVIQHKDFNALICTRKCHFEIATGFQILNIT